MWVKFSNTRNCLVLPPNYRYLKEALMYLNGNPTETIMRVIRRPLVLLYDNSGVKKKKKIYIYIYIYVIYHNIVWYSTQQIGA